MTTSDVIEFVVDGCETPSAGDRRGEKPRLLDPPVTDGSSGPAETTTAEASLADAVGTMLERGYDGLAVTREPTGDS